MPDDDDQAPSGLEAEKLRSGIFSFILWVARMGTPSTLQAVAPSAIDAVKQFIMSQGWPVPATPGHRLSGPEQHARSLAYETIGILKSKISHETLTEESVTSDIALLRWLLESLCLDYSSGQIPVSIDQALGSILNSFSSMSNGGSTIAYPAIVSKVQEELASLLTEFMALKE
ncbi:proteasome component M29, partial [Ascosphaera atra]